MNQTQKERFNQDGYLHLNQVIDPQDLRNLSGVLRPLVETLNPNKDPLGSGRLIGKPSIRLPIFGKSLRPLKPLFFVGIWLAWRQI